MPRRRRGAGPLSAPARSYARPARPRPFQRWSGNALAVGCLLFGLATGASARVVLVGIDGGSWNLVDPALARGELPNLAAIAARGVTADLESVEPLISPAVWTSIATGQPPRVHGVTSFRSTRNDQLSPTIFERLAVSGQRVGLYDYLVTWPPLQLPGGFVIPGWMRRDERTWPADVFERAGLTPYAYSTRDLRQAERIYRNGLREIAEKPGRFVRLLEHYDPQVAAVTFYALDAAAHRFWNAAFPEAFPESRVAPDPLRAGAIHEMLVGIDGAVGRITAALDPDDVVIVVSDHGFRADPDGVQRKWTIDLEALFGDAGLDPARDRFAVTSGWRKGVVEIARGDDDAQEALLQRWVDLAGSLRGPGGEALVEVAVARSRFSDVWVEALGQRLLDWSFGPGEKWYRPEAHAVVVISPIRHRIEALWPSGTLRVGAATYPIDDVFQPVDFSGDHTPVGIFLAAGGPIATSPERQRISVLDVAPLIAWLAGAAVPDDLAGLPLGVLDPRALATRPALRVPAAAIPRLPDAPAPAGGEGDLEERLRALGYAD